MTCLLRALKYDLGAFEKTEKDPLALTFDGPSPPPVPAPLPTEYALPEGYAEEFEEALEAALQAWVPPDVGGEGEPVQEGHPDPVEGDPPEPAGGDLEDDRGASDPDNSVLSDAVAGRLLRSAWWGPFHFTPKQAGANQVYGSYSVVCPWHAKNNRTGCSLARNIQGPTQWDREVCIRRLMWWCIQALDHSRQSSHFIAPSDVESCPTGAWLSANKPELPNGKYEFLHRRRHDVDLDFYNVPDAFPPPDSWDLCWQAEAEAEAEASRGQEQNRRGQKRQRGGRGAGRRGAGRGAEPDELGRGARRGRGQASARGGRGAEAVASDGCSSATSD